MKGILITFLMLAVSVDSIEGQALSADIMFEERVYNFGTIREEKGKVSHTFIFQNKGKTPVTIGEVNTGCGCIGKVVTKGPVKPGAKGKVTVTFDPSYKSGFFSKEIVVFSKEGKEYNRIWVEGTIEPTEHPIKDDYPYYFGNGLYLRLKVMAFGYIIPGETKQMELHYANGTDKEMNLSFLSDSNSGGLKFVNPGKIAPNARGVIVFSYTMPRSKTTGALFRFHPSVNGRKVSETLDVKILNGIELKKRQSPKARN